MNAVFYCERTKHMHDVITGKYKEKCGRIAIIYDNVTKRHMCQSCYNKYIKKLNKTNIIYLPELN